MALTTPVSSYSQLFQLPMIHPPSPSPYVPSSGYALIRSKCQVVTLRITPDSVLPVPSKLSSTARFRCCTKSTEEIEAETLTSDNDNDSREETRRSSGDAEKVENGSPRKSVSSLSDALNLGIREPVYEVVEVSSSGMVSTKKINRRDLLKSSGLRPRDIRSVDPSLWLTNTMPSLLVRENAILLNLGPLRAIAMQESVFIFNYNRRAGKAFIDSLLPRLNPKSTHGGPVMPFELEVVEAALHSRIQRFEDRLMELDPRVSMET